MKRKPLTAKGAERLRLELRRLKSEDRPRVIQAIAEARAHGDLSENAEYHAAKEAQGHLERKIAEVQAKLARVRAVDADQIPTDKVYLFAKVLVKDHKTGEEILYTIAPPEEIDIDNDVISVKSPIGASLLGKEVGDVVEIKVPAGVLTYEILQISRD